MFVILYYDVNSKRCGKMLRTCRRFLTWVQNSVFEGEISKAGFEELITCLKKIIKPNEDDSIIVYQFRTMHYVKRKVYGADKKGDTQFL
jgi:CRISPR-associated protein Cas2